MWAWNRKSSRRHSDGALAKQSPTPIPTSPTRAKPQQAESSSASDSEDPKNGSNNKSPEVLQPAPVALGAGSRRLRNVFRRNNTRTGQSENNLEAMHDSRKNVRVSAKATSKDANTVCELLDNGQSVCQSVAPVSIEPASVEAKKSRKRNTKEAKPGSMENLHDEESAKGRQRAHYDIQTLQDELTRINGQSWYHGLMPRDEIEYMLKEDGDHLVRITDVGGVNRFVISVRWKERVRHLVVGLRDKQWFVRKDILFANIEAMLSHYQTTKQELQRDGTCLRNPVARPTWYILHEHVKLVRKLGSGMFGDVFLGELSTEGRTVECAVKMLKGQMGKKERVSFLKEANINRKFNHPNIVRLLGVAPQVEPIMVLLELAPNGSLKTHVKENAALKVRQLDCFLYDAAKGLAYLSELGVIHRDVAARNCLLTKDYTVKISDFGLSVVKSELKENFLKKMPIRWLAPETLSNGVFTIKTDVWSYGIMMWEVYSRCQTDPYPGKTNQEARWAIQQGRTMDYPADTPDYAQSLMKSCWTLNPDERITFDKVVRRYRKIVEEDQ